jgi:hypothetical protein
MSDSFLTPRLERAARALFSNSDVTRATEILGGCTAERLALDSQALVERISAAALKQSGGSLTTLEAAVTLARTDWRDLLVAAGFGSALDAHEEWLEEVAVRHEP